MVETQGARHFEEEKKEKERVEEELRVANEKRKAEEQANGKDDHDQRKMPNGERIR